MCVRIGGPAHSSGLRSTVNGEPVFIEYTSYRGPGHSTTEKKRFVPARHCQRGPVCWSVNTAASPTSVPGAAHAAKPPATENRRH